MKPFYFFGLIAVLVIAFTDCARAKDYGAAVNVTARFDKQDIENVIPGETVSGEITFIATSNLERLKYSITNVSNATIENESQLFFENLTRNGKVTVKLKIRVIAVPCTFSIRYITETGKRTDWGITSYTLGEALKNNDQ